jgi:isopenicillin-N N-acyltransferase-like protein
MAGRQLGESWRADLLRSASLRPDDQQWWTKPIYRDLVGAYLPHLPDLYAGMAEGAGIARNKLVVPIPQDLGSGCTSFAIAPIATRDGGPICGQTKDAAAKYVRRNVILKLELTDAPSALTMTYPGMLFGHGFIADRCAIFRNSIAIQSNPKDSALPYNAWGILALHCRTVDEVCAVTERFPIAEPFHCTVCDSQGGIVGIEHADGDTAFLRPIDGIYTHANNILSDPSLLAREACDADYRRRSQHRRDRLMQRLREDNGRSTRQSVTAAMRDHDGHPYSVCNHESERFCTTAALVAEPAKGILQVTTSSPCCNAPIEHRLTTQESIQS